MPDVPIIGANGGNPDDARKAERSQLVYDNYGAFAAKLGALGTLLVDQPLEDLLEANKRHQSTVRLTVPQEQYHAISEGLRLDQKIIEAALGWKRILIAAQQQGAVPGA